MRVRVRLSLAVKRYEYEIHLPYARLAQKELGEKIFLSSHEISTTRKLSTEVPKKFYRVTKAYIKAHKDGIAVHFRPMG